MSYFHNAPDFPMKADGTPDYQAYQARTKVDYLSAGCTTTPGLLETYDEANDYVVETDPVKPNTGNSFLEWEE